jgi:hypothetical protein
MHRGTAAGFGATLVIVLMGQALAQANDCAQKLPAENVTVQAIIDCLTEKEQALAAIGDRVDQLQLTPGPRGVPGPKGDKGDKGDAGQAAFTAPGIVVASIAPCRVLGNGWVDYPEGAGKFIIGAGRGTDENGISETFVLSDKGGEYRHKLRISELPEHLHRLDEHNNTEEAFAGQADDRRGMAIGGSFLDRILISGSPDTRSTLNVVSSGPLGQPHPIMPPFVALHWCKKEQ